MSCIEQSSSDKPVADDQGKSSTSPESLIEIHWGGKLYTFSSPKDALKAGFHLS